MSGVRTRATQLAAVAAAMVLYALHAREYRGWLVDDAGISIAYARHLAAGQGLTSQPGVAPVEGFSNPSWVLLLAALDRAGALILPDTPKIAGACFVAFQYVLLVFVIDRIAVRCAAVLALTLFFCSINPSLVVWSTSGLENALYGAAIVALALATLVARERPSAHAATACGAIAALVAMTRPDGALFCLIPPLATGWRTPEERRGLQRYAASFAVPFAAFLLFRWITFHRLLPNTAVAKGGPTLDALLDLALFTGDGLSKAAKLFEAAVPSPLGDAAAAATVLGVANLARRGRLGPGLPIVLAFTLVAFADYMLLPVDWMPETRFGTAFLPLYYASALAILDRVLESPRVRRPRAALAALTGALVLFCVPAFARRAVLFGTTPTIDLFFVRRAFAERFDRYAEELGVRNGSVLLPDVGGMLLWSHLRIYDLAGLCDESVATLKSVDKERLRQLIFERMRPTFIHTYAKFSRTVDFERDARIATDYVPIHVYSDAEDPERHDTVSGILVRRDAIRTDRDRAALEAMRAENHARRGFMVPRPASPFLRWLAQMAPSTAASARPEDDALPGSDWRASRLP